MEHVGSGLGHGGVCARGALRRVMTGCLMLGAAPLSFAQAVVGETEPTRLPQVDLVMLATAVPTSSVTLQGTPASSGLRASPSLNLGLRWRPAPVAGRNVDAQLFRRVSKTTERDDDWQIDAPLYGAKVEMQMSRPQRVSLRDLLGVQLDNGARVSVRPRNGKLSLYYRVQF
jgi:hypothetical protein